MWTMIKFVYLILSMIQINWSKLDHSFWWSLRINSKYYLKHTRILKLRSQIDENDQIFEFKKLRDRSCRIRNRGIKIMNLLKWGNQNCIKVFNFLCIVSVKYFFVKLEVYKGWVRSSCMWSELNPNISSGEFLDLNLTINPTKPDEVHV